MDIFEGIKKRMSIRTYKKEEVSMDKVTKIVEAACMAPSWGNKQCWRFIIIDSHVEKNIIGNASGQVNIAKACMDAPYLIVICANTKESGVKNGMEYYLFDCALAMENLMLAAQAEGLSTCVVGWFDEKAIKGILNIPGHIKVVAFTPLGFSEEKILQRSRKKPNEVIFHNYWGKAFDS